MTWQWRFLADITGPAGDLITLAKLAEIEAAVAARETPEGAQEKADAAGVAANGYTDSVAATKVGNDDARLPREVEQGGHGVMDRTGAFASRTDDMGSTFIGGVEHRPLPANSPYWRAFMDRAGSIQLGLRKDGMIDGAFTGNGAVQPARAVRMIVVAGQSIAGGAAMPSGLEYDPIDSRIFQYGSRLNVEGVITPASVPLDQHDGSPGLSPATVMAREYLKNQPPGVVVLLIPAAHGGTGFYTTSERPVPEGYVGHNGTWQHDRDEPNNLYQVMVAQFLAGRAAGAAYFGVMPEPMLFYWGQGEADVNLTNQAIYAGHFDGMVGNFRSVAGVADLPVVVTEMSPDWVEDIPARLAIRAAHIQSAARLTRTAFAAGERHTGMYNDRIHYGRDGVEILGKNMLRAYYQALSNTADSTPMQPRNLRATFGGGTLQIEFDYPLGRATEYRLEYSIDLQPWVTINRAVPLDYKETVTGLSGSRARVRAATINPVATSATTQIINALGA